MIRSGHLNDDWAYVAAMKKQSEFPFKYVTRFSPQPPCPVSNCNKQFRTGAPQADEFERLGETPTRILEKGRRIHTELWGTSPFRARGDGQLYAPDVSNTLMRLPVSEQRCARPLAETEYPRFDYVGIPNQAEWWRRGGESARMGPIYVQPVAFGY